MATAVADDLKSLYHRAWWALMLRGLLGIVVGVLIVARPMESVAAFALVIAIWALFSGIVDIVHAFEMSKVLKHWWVLLLTGLVSVGFGVAAMIYYPVLALTFAVLWAAWWLMLTGILGVYSAMKLRGMGMDWGWPLTFGVLSFLAGIFALLSPPATLGAIMAIIATFAIVSGIVLVIGAFKLRSLVKG
jgi:uncharacterized membrane protein HdeD (DUF308 family)